MDDNDFVCPLCCEELDLSDRQFYPCKCGYQVCMWCWHRIREQESGLCPACRTPYGDDPHEFSAVDVEEVLKANKEKAAAEKRERMKQQQAAGESADAIDSDTEAGAMDPPKDRTQLANMRVIRRNLVYAVGLPPNIANEDTLRKPEYFGQYGKISKIVLNRNHVTSGDPRRASASAYVTFVHKEDTLACILALDGHTIDERKIRASYGTSKYCSAFVKNVRCNNPECTYLHHMGAAEDTFTKQEIQAGYVTSGRDVLERQQQIVQQELSTSSGGGGQRRRKVGGGGPSGTGKAAANPVLPAPTYDEPPKQSGSSLVPAPVPIARATTTGPAFPNAVSVTGGGGKGAHGRSVSVGETAAAAPNMRRASISGPAPGVSAASVVAGVHTVTSQAEAPSPHTMLTSLTPLKRTTSQPKNRNASIGATLSHDSNDSNRLSSPKVSETKFKKQQDLKVQHAKTNGAQKVGGTAATSPSSSISSLNNDSGVGSLGGTIIGPAPGPSNGGAVGAIGGGRGLDSGSLGGQVIGGTDLFPTRSSVPIGGGGSGSSSSGLWDSQAPIGGSSIGVIGGGGGFGSIGGSGMLGGYNSESSALASMLGISLPSGGSGSLREPSPLMQQQQQQQHSFQSSSSAGVIGARGSHPAFGHAVGMPAAPRPSGGGSKSDIALLQSLLPGVHITSGNAQQPAAPSMSSGSGGGGGGWNPLSNEGELMNPSSWNGNYGGSMLGQTNEQREQQRGQSSSSSSIW